MFPLSKEFILVVRIVVHIYHSLALLDYAPLSACVALPGSEDDHRYLFVNTNTAALEAAEIDDVRSIHVSRSHLQSNCVAIAAQSATHSALYLNIPEAANVNERSELSLVDSSSLTPLMHLPLKLTEFPISVASAPLYQLPAPSQENQTEYYIVGTAFMLPSESEPTSGRILIFRVEGEGMKRQLQLVCEHHVNGGCLAINAYQGKIIAGINSEIMVLDFDPVSLSIQMLCKRADNVCITSLSVDSEHGTVAVGDTLRSVSLYKFTVECVCGKQWAQLEYVAGELTRRNITALDRVPEQHEKLVVGDAYGNVCIMSVIEDTEIDRTNPQKHVVVREWFHLDDQVNRFVAVYLFRSGSQINETAKLSLTDDVHTESGIQFNMAFGTVSGQIGIIGMISDDEYSILHCIEQVMNKVRFWTEINCRLSHLWVD